MLDYTFINFLLMFQHCLEKIQDHRDKLTCPQCHADTQLGASGVSGLLSDFGVSGLIETAVAGSMDFQVKPDWPTFFLKFRKLIKFI